MAIEEDTEGIAGRSPVTVGLQHRAAAAEVVAFHNLLLGYIAARVVHKKIERTKIGMEGEATSAVGSDILVWVEVGTGKLVFARHKQAAAMLTDKADISALGSAGPNIAGSLDIADHIDRPSLWLRYDEG